VDELFDLSKIESKERKLSLATFDVAELVFDTINSFKVTAQEKGVELINNVRPGLVKVNADIELIDRVLHNLINNAIKYCDRNDKVEILATEAEGALMITVRDSGSGISAEDLPHVFNRFHKGKTARQGTGLGLAIVKGVLELHHSTYNVSSELGKGTTFNFSLKKAE
jgi:signal transduction histidine kinase